MWMAKNTMRSCSSLHSTMFLLKQNAWRITPFSLLPLHSTMFLLKLHQRWSLLWRPDLFTFHNVSIKTEGKEFVPTQEFTLHSTMFLLKLGRKYLVSFECYTLHSTMFLLKHSLFNSFTKGAISFTFHNVSIKTLRLTLLNAFKETLHSTMFLLKRFIYCRKWGQITTLHSTMFLLKLFTIQKYIVWK